MMALAVSGAGLAGAGLAVVVGFASLAARQVAAISVMLAIQSAAVVVTALVVDRPLLAIPPVVLSAGIWLLQHRILDLDWQSDPVGGARASLAIGAVLSVLCQSQGRLALPLATILLSILLAATRTEKFLRLVALAAMQNGIMLAGCLMLPREFAVPEMLDPAWLLPIACLAPPLAMATGLFTSSVWPSRPRPARDVGGSQGIAGSTGAAVSQGIPGSAQVVVSQDLAVSPDVGSVQTRSRRGASPAWIDLTFAVAIFAATLIIPLDSLASTFAPLLGLDGVMQACRRVPRPGLTPSHRFGALLQSACTVAAVSAPTAMAAWLAISVGAAASLLPVLPRRWHSAELAFPAINLGLFAALLLSAAPSMLAYFSLFAGVSIVACVLPDLAPALGVLLLRLADQGPWPPMVEAMGAVIALAAVLVCAILLLQGSRRPHRATLLQLSQVGIAALAICLGQPDGRFAGMLLLILLILVRAALRIADGPAAALAMAGLAGVPPLGVFPATVLVILALTEHQAWLLLALLVPLLVNCCSIMSQPFTCCRPGLTIRAIAWLPLLLAVVVGYLAPDGLVHWWRAIIGGGI